MIIRLQKHERNQCRDAIYRVFKTRINLSRLQNIQTTFRRDKSRLYKMRKEKNFEKEIIVDKKCYLCISN